MMEMNGLDCAKCQIVKGRDMMGINEKLMRIRQNLNSCLSKQKKREKSVVRCSG